MLERRKEEREKEKKGEVSEFSEGDDRNGDSTPHPLCENRTIDRSMRFFAFPLSLSSAFSTTYSTINRRFPFLGRRERSTVNRGGHSRTVGNYIPRV